MDKEGKRLIYVTMDHPNMSGDDDRMKWPAMTIDYSLPVNSGTMVNKSPTSP